MLSSRSGPLEFPGNVRGGLAGAMAALGIALPLGLLSYAALGPDAAPLGVRAAFVATIVGGLVMALVGGVAIPGAIPRTPSTLVFAGYVTALATDPTLVTAHGPDTATILVLTALCVSLSGVLQIGFGVVRLGSIVRYVPLPVVAGFMNGIAILIIVSQIQILLGVAGSHWYSDLAGRVRDALPAIALCLATSLFTWLFVRRWPRSPWALIGFVFGAAIAYLIHWWAPEVNVGSLRSAPAAGLPDIPAFQLFAAPALADSLRVHLPQLAATAVIIAIIGAMDALLSAVAMDTTLQSRHRANRLLIGQGLGNLASGALGGLPVAYSIAVPLSVHRAGGRGIVAGFVTVAALLAIVVFGRDLLGLIPSSVSAGIMLIIALGLFDRWSGRVLGQLLADRGNRDAQWSLGVVLLVCLTTVVFGFAAAIFAGVLLSFVLFIVSMNRSLVRSVATGATRMSRRIYFPDQERLLRAQGERIKLIELEGAVFFGTVERLTQRVDALCRDAHYVILDVKRVTTVDASGVIALERIAVLLKTMGASLLLSGLLPGDRHAQALEAFGNFTAADRQQWFPDADHALEHAERRLLAAAGVVSPTAELPFERLSLLENLSLAHREALRERLARVTLESGEVLFRKGEPGDRLFVLAKGSVSVLSNTGEVGVAQRLASFTPGVIFGETAMLDGGGRTATGIADEPSVVYVLTRDTLDDIGRTDPTLAVQVLLNLARQLSARMRFASETIQRADY